MKEFKHKNIIDKKKVNKYYLLKKIYRTFLHDMVPECIKFAHLMSEGANFEDCKRQSYLTFVVNMKFS